MLLESVNFSCLFFIGKFVNNKCILNYNLGSPEDQLTYL